MASPEEWGLNDHDAVMALRERLQYMSLSELEEARDNLLADVNAIPQRQLEFDERVAAARHAIDAARLTATLARTGADDLEQKQQLLEAAVAARQRFRIERARIDYTLKEVNHRITWIHENEAYKAKSFAMSAWRDEYDSKLKRVREDLSRLIALYCHINGIKHPSQITRCSVRGGRP